MCATPATFLWEESARKGPPAHTQARIGRSKTRWAGIERTAIAATRSEDRQTEGRTAHKKENGEKTGNSFSRMDRANALIAFFLSTPCTLLSFLTASSLFHATGRLSQTRQSRDACMSYLNHLSLDLTGVSGSLVLFMEPHRFLVVSLSLRMQYSEGHSRGHWKDAEPR